jgi:hypothetical protein
VENGIFLRIVKEKPVRMEKMPDFPASPDYQPVIRELSAPRFFQKIRSAKNESREDDVCT